MPEGDHRFDARGFELPRHFDITADRGLVVAAGLRFDPRPLDAESIMVHADLFQRFKISVEVAPAELCVVAFRRNPLFLGKQVPVRLEKVWRFRRLSPVFSLERAGGHAPPEGSGVRRL
jgi:hypothetical protein